MRPAPKGVPATRPVPRAARQSVRLGLEGTAAARRGAEVVATVCAGPDGVRALCPHPGGLVAVRPGPRGVVAPRASGLCDLVLGVMWQFVLVARVTLLCDLSTWRHTRVSASRGSRSVMSGVGRSHGLVP